jgi:hypothetical protein
MTAARRLFDAQRANGGLPIALAAVLSLANLLLPGMSKAFLGLPLALAAPGYCVAILVFGSAAWTDRFDGVVRLAVICVLSLAAWPLLVLAAYAVYPHVSALSTELCFLVLAVATLVRVQVLDGARRTAGSTNTSTPTPAPAPAPRGIPRAPLAAIAVILAGGTLTLALAHTLPPQQSTSASTASLAGAAATADAPLPRTSPLTGSVDVAIYNPAPETRQYLVTAAVAHASSWNTVSITVPPGAQRSADLVGTLPATGCLTRVTVMVSDAAEKLDPLDTYFQGNASGDCHG